MLMVSGAEVGGGRGVCYCQHVDWLTLLAWACVGVGMGVDL